MDKNETVGNQKISALFDSGTFVETNAYLKRKGESAGYEGVISGYGAIEGKLTFAFVQDSERMKGAFDALAAKKIAALYEMAMKNGAPVIGVFDSAGAVVAEGSEVLSAYGAFLKCVSSASGVIPQIAVVTGVCSGLSSVAASMFDMVVTVKDKSELSFHSAFGVGADKIGEVRAAVSDLVASDEREAFGLARKLVSLIPSNCAEGVAIGDSADDCNRAVDTAAAGSVTEAISAVADAGTLLVLEEECRDGVTTALARLGGVCVGLIGAEGAVTVCGTEKLNWFMDFCNRFRIPVITLVDSEGITADTQEEACLSLSMAAYAKTVAKATTPRISVVVGKAYGAAFTLLASKPMGSDLTLALTGTKISPMAPDAAVAFLCNDRVTAEKSRAQVESEWAEENADASLAAANGDVDDIIAPAELRQRLCSAVYMLMRKADVAVCACKNKFLF